MMKKRKIIILGQVGSPKSTSTADVRSYLREFLSDPRVVDFPRVLWFIVLNLFILPTRPRQSAKAYKRIEVDGKFPLVETTRKMKFALGEELPGDYIVDEGFLLSDKRFKSALAEYDPEKEGQAENEIWVLPQFPQYSDTTTTCFKDQIESMGMTDRVSLIPNYHRLKAFIQLSARKIEHELKSTSADELVISFHGIPVRYVVAKKDIYYKHCFETYLLLKKEINFPDEKINISFQSRLGSEEWLSPYTDEFCADRVKAGVGNIAVYCPSFVVDCLETTDEIGFELREMIEELGGELSFVPCLNTDQLWVNEYAKFIKDYIEYGPEKAEDHCYGIDEVELKKIMPELEMKSKPLDMKAKKTIKVVFVTLFLDLIGFSIIFPMFPSLAKYYLEVDPNNYFLKLIFGTIDSFTTVGGSSMSGIVLFGGALGAIYSLLQFIAAPIWGGLSDKYGRKPVLMVSIFGLTLSYILWFFSGSFTLLILARFLGGVMGGNLSVATAAVADVTDRTNRSKGMAFVGIAFACGFIFGPAIGGILTLFNPMDHFPTLIPYGLNPFSYAAGFAAVLGLLNLVLLLRNFEETLVKKEKEENFKTANLLKIFKPLPHKEVNRTNLVYFLFISAFSGMEFTLTFLAVEKLNYTSMDNAYMFIFIGFIIAFVQGGYVRRKAHSIGEKKMAIQGLLFVIPGLFIIGFSESNWLLYAGLFFLATGSAMAIPTLTSLVSIYTPDAEQGRSLGIFRSLGSLGRVIGPVFASLIYWKYGSTVPYVLGGFFLLIPVFLLTKLKKKTNFDNDDSINA